jgi:ELWxxDGT repeat protein
LRLEVLEDRSVPSSGLSASLVADVFPGTDSSNPQNLTNVSGTLYFGEGGGSTGLWKSDGTAAGTVFLGLCGYQSPGDFTPFSGSVYFSSGGLWKTDGTPGGTVSIASATVSDVSDLTVVNGRLFFHGSADKSGGELWVTDGTTAGTKLVKDIYPGSVTSSGGRGGGRGVGGGGKVTIPNSSEPNELTNLNGKLYFTATDGIHGWQLWTSDGTANGTTMVTAGAANSYPEHLLVVNGVLYFGTAEGLWKSDGTAAGTVLVKGFIYSLPSGSTFNGESEDTRVITAVNGTLYFAANDGIHGAELWKSDGTIAGTGLVKDINPGAADADPVELTNVNGLLYFVANDETHGDELWKSDGTQAGTVMVKDISSGSASAFSAISTFLSNGYVGPWIRPWLTNVNGLLYFAADDGITGTELWQSDGTASGTIMVQDIYPGAASDGAPASSYPSHLVSMNNKLYFAATDPVHGTELWDPPPVVARQATGDASRIQQFVPPIDLNDSIRFEVTREAPLAALDFAESGRRNQARAVPAVTAPHDQSLIGGSPPAVDCPGIGAPYRAALDLVLGDLESDAFSAALPGDQGPVLSV